MKGLKWHVKSYTQALKAIRGKPFAKGHIPRIKYLQCLPGNKIRRMMKMILDA